MMVTNIPWITLTDVENGVPIHVNPGFIRAIYTEGDMTHVLIGERTHVIVKESAGAIRQLIAYA